MPYHVVMKGSQFCVRTKGTENEHGCHPSREMANAQMRALYNAMASEAEAADAVPEAEALPVEEAGRKMSSRSQSAIVSAMRGFWKALTDAGVDPAAIGEADEDGGDGDVEEKQNDPNVGGGVDRDKLPASDFAGKNRSFPIVTPGDVQDAAASIGRAGGDNYSADQLKRRIIAIARRKGPSFVAKLPKAWRDGMSEADQEESADLDTAGAGGPVLLEEKAVRPDGTVQIRLIGPGWGASGYYSAEMLERDGPAAFPSGTHMFWNHQTDDENKARPEGDLRNLAGVLVEDAAWDAEGPAGPGLYAPARVFSGYKETIEELAPHIGNSIRAYGFQREGEAEGRTGKIVTALGTGKSVDFVTRAGAGGRVVEMFEAAPGAAPLPPVNGQQQQQQHQEGEGMPTDAEWTALQESLAQEKTARLVIESRLRESDAREHVRAGLAAVRLPDQAKERVLAQAIAALPLTEAGALDRDALTTRLTELAEAERAYIQAVAPQGAIVGMGSIGTPTPELTEEQATANLAAALGRLTGLSESASLVAAKGR